MKLIFWVQFAANITLDLKKYFGQQFIVKKDSFSSVSETF